MPNIDIDPLETVVTKKEVAVVTSKNDNAVTFDLEQIALLAGKFNLDMGLSRDARLDRAVTSLSHSAQYMLAAGIDLMSLKNELEHGQFQSLLKDRGVEYRTAARAMQYTAFVLSLSPAEQEKMLTLPKSHVLALASADPEVVQDLLDSDDKELAALSVRQLRETIKSLDRKKTDVTTQLEAVELENKQLNALVKELRENRIKTAGAVPIAVQDVRLECAALHKNAELAISGIDELRQSFAVEDIPEWEPSVCRHIVGALMSLHAQISGVLATARDEFGESSGVPGVMDLLGEEEIIRCAQEYKTLIEEHRHDEALRKWEREMSRPQGKGRPKSKPIKGEE